MFATVLAPQWITRLRVAKAGGSAMRAVIQEGRYTAIDDRCHSHDEPSGGDMSARVMIILITLLAVGGGIGTCVCQSPPPPTLRGNTPGVATHAELLERYALGEGDRPDGAERDDDLSESEVSAEALDRVRHTLVDPVGPLPGPDGRRFAIDVREALGPRPMAEALRLPGASDRPLSTGQADSRGPMVVTVRGRVRNLVERDCIRVILKASYVDETGVRLSEGSATVTNLEARGSRGIEFELHLMDWPEGHDVHLDALTVYEAYAEWVP